MRDAPGAFNCPPVNLDIKQTPPTINIVGQRTYPSDPLLAHFSKKKTYFPQILSQIRD